MNILSRNRRLIIAAAAGALIVLSGFAIWSGQEGATASGQSEAHFSVLEPAKGADESLISPAVKMLLATSTGSDVSDDITAFGKVETSSGKEVVVLEIGKNVCFSGLPRGPANCGEAALVQSGNLYVASPLTCDTVEVTGIVPDGVDSLVVESGGEQERRVDVSSNVYSAKLAAAQTTLSSVNGTIRFDLPLEWFASQNSECNR